MADYRELLRKAVDALPENNGAARRQVYEKARTALVTQLRAIQPPLPPREITQHRLQLEDCIRQVEQHATDALLGSLKKLEEDAEQAPLAPQTGAADEAAETATGAAADAAVATPEDEGAAADLAEEAIAAQAVDEAAELPVAEEASAEQPEEAEDTPVVASETEADAAEDDAETVDTESTTDGAETAAERPGDPFAAVPGASEDEDDSGADLAELEAALRAETGEDDTVSEAPVAVTPAPETPVPSHSSQITGITKPSSSVEQLIAEAGLERPVADASKPGSIGYLIAQAQAAADRAAVPARWKQDTPSLGGTAAAASAVAVAHADSDTLVAERPANQSEPVVAMSAVREVEVEAQPETAADSDGDPQGAIDRAIETLDREARGESTEDGADNAADSEAVIAGAADASGAPETEGGGNALTIFLVLFALLLAGVGGAGYWAWQEGYIDPDAMFGQSEPVTEMAATETPADSGTTTETPAQQPEGPGNTAATPNAVAPVSEELGKSEERLPGSETPATETATATPPETAGATENGATDSAASDAASADAGNKSEERLPTEGSFDSGETAAAEGAATGTENGAATAVAPVGAQSLLLEATEEGTTGAVPYSGTVEWSRGTDELGQPTILATANIPARNLGVSLLIRRNADPALPASHLMEVDFTVSESFIGGAIAGLPGILLKNEELVRGTPLVGASARVVGNSFLFALSAAEQDVSTNTNLLQSRKWMDLALVYATGNRAIITLEKDAEAQALFDEVMAAWTAAGDADAGAGAAPAEAATN